MKADNCGPFIKQISMTAEQLSCKKSEAITKQLRNVGSDRQLSGQFFPYMYMNNMMY